MDTLLSLKVFRQVVESGSFTGAAQVLDMSVAMVSKHVMHLERRLGTRLLQRTSRKVSLNDVGALYYERAGEALNLLEEAESALGLSPDSPRGTLRVTAPAWFCGSFFARLLHGYGQACPEVKVDVSLSDAVVDLVDQGLDLGLRVLSRPPGGVHARALGPVEFVRVVAASGSSVPDIAYAYATGAGGARWRTNNTILMAELALQGAAPAVLPRLLLGDERYRGLRVLEGEGPGSATLYAVTPGRKHLTARVRVFVDYLATHLPTPAR